MSDKEKILGIMAGFDLILSPENYGKCKESMNKQREEKDKEIKRLKKRLEEAQLAYLAVEEKNKRLNNIIKEVREYITSYESIETIQQFDHNKNNKDLDYSTIDEMTRRYMMVHDKILKILDKENI